MLITEIKKTKKGRFSVYGEGVYLFSLHPEIFTAAHLTAGQDVPVEDLERLRLQDEEKEAKNKALRLLSRAAHSRAGLRQKLLASGYLEEAADKAVERMEELGLIDDADYAWRLGRDYLHLRHFGIGRVRRELAAKGVDGQIIEETADRLMADDDPGERIAQVIRRKYPTALGDEKGRRRCIAGLMRLGYSYGEIYPVLRALGDEMDDDEGDDL